MAVRDVPAPPALRQPPRDPEAAMIHLDSWWVFTVNGVPTLYERQRVMWPTPEDGRKRLLGYDWIPCGPVAEPRVECPCITDIRALVAEHQRGLT